MNDAQRLQLTLPALEREMGEDAFGVCLYVYDKTASTNLSARQLVMDGFRGEAILAASEQSAGRGRLGRTFYSPAGCGAYFSILHTTKEPRHTVVRLTSAAAVAVMRAIRTLTGIACGIKWVNDLYLHGKKVCGILTEALPDPNDPILSHVIVGIGINWHPATFDEELAHIAASVGVTDVSRAALIAEVWRELSPFLNHPEDTSWLDDYRKHSTVLDKEVLWIENGTAHHGIAVGIDEEGALLVEDEAGTLQALRTGEITLRVEQER